MHNFVQRYVQFCQTYVQEKFWHVKKQDVLRLLSVLMKWWCDILIDFVVKLSNSNEYMNVMIVVNQLTKMRHMILLKMLDVIEVAEVFTKNIFKLHALPDTIVSDHEDQFILTFWKMLCKWLQINAWLSTAFHSETDEQIKIVNMIMKQYLQMYCSYLQDDWEKWLSLTEFTTNNTTNKSTDITSFYAIYRQDSQIEFESQTEIDEHDSMIK